MAEKHDREDGSSRKEVSRDRADSSEHDRRH